ncbi:COG4695 Phage-related protein [uncultured Caudovirales phage]|uniref:COG4695 Phage-related protein n=1 Tax=uncultured Caudovirales phage TaxID=2100421 RepID=A0A6J5TBA2_9CAUD|nr:COG4695 Phage-related protein [uncultured Caudovirales phage]
MKLLDIFASKKPVQNESNAVFGQQQLGNQILAGAGNRVRSQQLLYVTTASTTVSGRTVNVQDLTKNSTVMSCVAVKARSLAQCGIRVLSKADDGTYVDAISSDKVSARDKFKAKQVYNLLTSPNSFQSAYEFWYQWSMWHDLAGEAYTLWFRDKADRADMTPIEMYNLDASLITVALSASRYPTYRISTSVNDYAYGYANGQELASHQVMHITDMAWQGVGGFNKGILAAELVGLDQDIDIYANYVMQNGAKPSGIFSTSATIPDGKWTEVAARLKSAWSSLVNGTQSAQSQAGQGMLLDQGMSYTPIDMLNLQDADAAALKLQTMKRICGVFGVPPAMVGIADQKYNNTQTMLDEFYKTTMYPMTVAIEQKLKQQLLKGYPNLSVCFDTKDFLKGAALDQMNFAVAGVNAGILTPNEAREYLAMPNHDDGDTLAPVGGAADPIPGSSPQDTGGGGGNQKSRMNIGAK